MVRRRSLANGGRTCQVFHAADGRMSARARSNGSAATPAGDASGRQLARLPSSRTQAAMTARAVAVLPQREAPSPATPPSRRPAEHWWRSRCLGGGHLLTNGPA